MLQELTEEGLPFVVLFHHPEDHNSVTQFKQVVESELMEETSEQLIRHVNDMVTINHDRWGELCLC